MTKLVIDIPEELNKSSLLKEEQLSRIALQAVKDALLKEILLVKFDNSLSNSGMTDELAISLGNDLKKSVAKRHSLI